eukprot:XP_001699488.1 predicted protein [Chlamydomonas reinhardtii]
MPEVLITSGSDSAGSCLCSAAPLSIRWCRDRGARRLSNVQQLWIYPFTHYKPTNQVMLCYRTLFQDLGGGGGGRYPRPTYIAADLSQQQASQHAPPQQQAAQHTQQAQHAAFDPALRTLFTVEGLLYYLPPPAVRRLLGSIREVAAPGSLVAFDYLEQDVFAGRRFAAGYETLRLTVANKGEPKRSGLDPEQLPAYLGALGWRLTYAPTPRQCCLEPVSVHSYRHTASAPQHASIADHAHRLR